MNQKAALTLLACETLVVIILTALLFTPKETLLKLSDIFHFKYKIVLVKN